jgi:membrane-associated phospholipid phosphatase
MLFDWDRKLFFFINHHSANSFFDWLMPVMRNSKTWLPLYVLIICYAIYQFRKKGLWWVVFAACAVLLCNYISSDLIKENIWRTRPCHEPSMNAHIRKIIGYWPQSSSFTSSHATNHFGMAAFIFFTGRQLFKNWLYFFFLWATLIIYAQVYVGVHYPTDVIAGAFVGTTIGYAIARLFNKRFGMLIFDKQSAF